ncbi:DUF3862 domain-containing protein [Flavonifractor hominis]|uniref:DUF3862 domain-containing protein n=1 Tax=Flavonifractor hominis TaxID=3133178 RepID=A0ABV1ERR6_9FIRM
MKAEERKTKKCKYCQSDIDAKATVCPVCKHVLKQRHGCLISILAVIIVLGGFGLFFNMSNDLLQKNVSGVTDESQYITMEEYNQIQSGMTYDQVVEIIGGPGESTASSGSGNYQIDMYTWYGNGTAGSNASITFTNGMVSAKAQIGLE